MNLNRRFKIGQFCNLKVVLFVFGAVILGMVWLLKLSHAKLQGRQDFIPSTFQKKWSWLLNSDNEVFVSECDFESYILGQQIEQSDECLVEVFKKKFLQTLPNESQDQLPSSAKHSSNDIPSNAEKLKWLELLVINNLPDDQKEKGFFIECGANDGRFLSPAYRLEKEYNWTGLLIEANPIPFQTLLRSRQRSWASNVALCTSPHPQQVTFFTNPKNTGLSGLNVRNEHGVNVNTTVQCIPLYTMLLSLDKEIVEYLSLDVEGVELEILKTVPFEEVIFKVMTVEYGLVPGKQKALKNFLEPRGYKFVKEFNDKYIRDCLFVHESLFDLAKRIKI